MWRLSERSRLDTVGRAPLWRRLAAKQKRERAQADSILINVCFARGGGREEGEHCAIFCADFVSSHHRLGRELD